MGLDITELKKAKEKLQKSQQDVTDILNSISDPFLVLDSQWCYTYVNQVEASLFGKTVEELIGKNYLALFPNLVDSVFYQNYYKAMVEKVPMHFESKGVYLNSWFETHVYPLQNGIIIYARDITEKKLLEQELQQSEERFRTAIENMLDCFGIFKAIRNNSGQIEDFLVEYVNEAACRNDAMTKDEQSGKRLRDVFPNIRVTELFDEYCKVVETGEPLVKDDLKWVNRYQKRGAYDLRSVKLGDGVAVAWRNVTERMEAEEALRQSEERFSKAFHSSPCMMSIFSLPEYRIVDVNQYWLNAVGFAREEVIGKPIEEIGTLPKATFQRAIQRQNEYDSVNNLETVFLNKKGEERYGLLSGEIITINGEPCLLAAMIDITERKQMEKEIARLDRFSLIGEMAAGIAHEIRNPMTVVRGYLQMLQNNDEFTNYKKRFNTMIEELDRANAIISEYLSLAKNKAVHLRKQSLNSILETMLPLIQAEAIKNNQSVTLELSDIPDQFLDDKEIRQIVLNLVRNGLEAMPARGALTIRTYLDGTEVVLAVQNHGPEIPPEVLEKIGTPFFTTKENGTGLGMAVCYSIAARHNATINVETSPEMTTFMVRFKR